MLVFIPGNPWKPYTGIQIRQRAFHSFILPTFAPKNHPKAIMSFRCLMLGQTKKKHHKQQWIHWAKTHFQKIWDFILVNGKINVNCPYELYNSPIQNPGVTEISPKEKSELNTDHKHCLFIYINKRKRFVRLSIYMLTTSKNIYYM